MLANDLLVNLVSLLKQEIVYFRSQEPFLVQFIKAKASPKSPSLDSHKCFERLFV